MRGVRWGAILVLALLLTIAAYRTLVSSPATASQAVPAPVAKPEATPALSEPAIEVKSEPAAQTVFVQKSPQEEVPVAPPVRRSALRSERTVALPPVANSFIPAAVPAPRPATRAVVVEAALPDATGFGISADLPKSGQDAQFAPPPEEKPGRTGKMVRSVGRILRIGRKDAKETPDKQ